MIKLPDGRLFDGDGIKTEDQVEEYYGDDIEGDELVFVTDSDGSIVNRHGSEMGSGLFTHCHKDSYDDIYNIMKNYFI